MTSPVRAIGSPARTTNAQAIADCVTLGYIRQGDNILDPTYGLGRWWTAFFLDCHFTRADIDPTKSGGVSIDFTIMPWPSSHFDVVTFDPPYKLNGTSTAGSPSDEGYGVSTKATIEERHDLIFGGINECVRVCRRTLLIKCQDQVSSGKKRWQTRLFADHAEAQGATLVDSMLVSSYRDQPAGRSQQHVRSDYSTLLIFKVGQPKAHAS